MNEWDQDMADRAKHSSMMWIKAENKFKTCLKLLIVTNVFWITLGIIIIVYILN